MTTELTRDARAKISAETDQVIAGVAHSRGCEKQDVIREVLDAWAGKTLHECSVIVRFARSEGKPGQEGT